MNLLSLIKFHTQQHTTQVIPLTVHPYSIRFSSSKTVYSLFTPWPTPLSHDCYWRYVHEFPYEEFTRQLVLTWKFQASFNRQTRNSWYRSMSSYQVSCFRSLLCPFIADEDPFCRPCLPRLSELSVLTPIVLFFSADPWYKEGRIPEVPWKKWSYWCSDQRYVHFSCFLSRMSFFLRLSTVHQTH